MNYEIISWSQIESDLNLLVKKIEISKRNFSSIYTISRGGLVPSRLLADLLDIKKIHVDSTKIPSKSLIVDDIYDSGTTFKKISGFVEDIDFTFATIYARSKDKYPKQLVYGKLVTSDDYLVFPWDKVEFFKNEKFNPH
jgi:hypoxanthine phosphoribosyltransferase